MDVAVAATRYREMLALRDKHGLDAIRDSIADKSLTFDSLPGFDKIMCVSWHCEPLQDCHVLMISFLAARTCRSMRDTTCPMCRTPMSSTSS